MRPKFLTLPLTWRPRARGRYALASRSRQSDASVSTPAGRSYIPSPAQPDRVFRSVAERRFTLSPVGRRSNHRDASIRYACRSGGMFLGRSKVNVYNNVYNIRWIMSFNIYNSIGY